MSNLDECPDCGETLDECWCEEFERSLRHPPADSVDTMAEWAVDEQRLRDAEC